MPARRGNWRRTTEIPPRLILSGGQTGADRAALDWAIARGLPHGGWCPRGRRAEDGPIAAHYRLRETPTQRPAQRTEWNVRGADGTVIFSMAGTLTGGSLLTWKVAQFYRKPCLHLSRERSPDPAAQLRAFIARHRIQTLNVAGPRASEAPAIGRFVRATLARAWGNRPASRSRTRASRRE